MSNIISDKDELGIYTNTPFFERFIKGFSTFIYFVFLTQAGAFITDVLFGILIALMVSSRLRADIANGWINTIIVIVLIAVFYGWGVLLGRYILGWVSRVLFGRPVFGKIGGLDKVTFFTVLEACKNVKFEFREEDEFVRQHNRLDAEMTEEFLKTSFFQIPENVGKDEKQLEKDWSSLWKDKLLNVGKGEATFKDLLSEDNITSRIIPLTLFNSSRLISPFVKFFQLVMVYFTVRYLNGETQLLLVIQIGVFLSFVLTLFWFIFHSIQTASEVLLLVNYEALPAEIRDKFAKKAEPFINKKLIPKKITVKSTYYSLVRGYQLRNISFSFLNVALILVMVAFMALVELIRNSANKASILTWYQHFSIGNILIPLLFYAAFYLISLLIQNFRQFILVVITGLLAAVLPFIVNYLATGNLSIGDVRSAVYSAVSGVGVALSTIIIAQIKNSREDEEDT